MILHFSHIGLTDGRTFTLLFALVVTYLQCPAARLWRPVRSPLPRCGARSAKACATDAPLDVSKVAGSESGSSRTPTAGLVPGRENPRTVGGDGDRELEMGG